MATGLDINKYKNMQKMDMKTILLKFCLRLVLAYSAGIREAPSNCPPPTEVRIIKFGKRGLVNVSSVICGCMIFSLL